MNPGATRSLIPNSRYFIFEEPSPEAILEPLAELGELPTNITDVIFSHYHPDHTLNAALFPNARINDHALQFEKV